MFLSYNKIVSKRILLTLLLVLGLAVAIIFIFIFRIDPFSLSVKEILFFIFLVFLIIFCLVTFLQLPLMLKKMQKKGLQIIILRRSLFIALYLSLILALQIFNAFSILGVVLLLGVFLLLEFYFNSK